MSEFVDGGGADGGGDHGDHGHDGGHHGSKHGSLAQLLGIDQDTEHSNHGDHGEAPQQTGIWNSALKWLNLKTLTQGIVITPSFLFLLLFLAFSCWLGVIYWIRHHEPFANQVLGSGSAYAPTASYDRHLINGVREAMPVHTTDNMGLIYTPRPGQGLALPQAGASGAQPMPQVAQGSAPGFSGFMPGGPVIVDPNMRSVRTFGLRGRNQAAAYQKQALQSGAMQGAMPAMQAQPLPPPAPTSWSLAAGGFSQETAQFNSQFGTPVSDTGVFAGGDTGMFAGGANGGQMAYRDHYYVPVQSEGGTRLKVFTNR